MSAMSASMRGAAALAEAASTPPAGAQNVAAYALAAAGFALAAVALLACALLLSRARRPRPGKAAPARPATSARVWFDRLDDVVRREGEGRIDTDEAMRELAGIARGYASERLGHDLDAHTLADLRRERRAKGRGIDALRTTVAALYPPEFADPAHDARAAVDVPQAAGWVRAMIERWR